MKLNESTVPPYSQDGRLKSCEDLTVIKSRVVEDEPEDDSDNFPAPPSWPVLQSETLRGLAGDFVQAACDNSEADPAAVLATFLTTFGAAIGPGCTMYVGDTKHYPRLYSLICGASSRARKGTSTAPVLRLLEAACKLTGAQGLQYAHGGLSSAEGLICKLRDPQEKEGKDGATIFDKGASDKRLLVIEDEFGGVLRTFKRDGNNLSAALRTFWDHGNLSPLTKHDSVKTTGAHLNVVGHITLQELSTYLNVVDIWNGLANRLLFVCARRQQLVAVPQKMPDDILSGLAARFALAVQAAQKCPEVTLSPDAKLFWSEIYPSITYDEPGILGVVTARSEAQILRLAMIYFFLSWADYPDGHTMIEPEHLDSALAFFEYSRQSAKHIFGETLIDANKQKILSAITAEPMSQTAIQKLFNNHIDTARLQKILQELESSGKIQREVLRGPGRSKTMWSITNNR